MHLACAQVNHGRIFHPVTPMQGADVPQERRQRETTEHEDLQQSVGGIGGRGQGHAAAGIAGVANDHKVGITLDVDALVGGQAHPGGAESEEGGDGGQEEAGWPAEPLGGAVDTAVDFAAEPAVGDVEGKGVQPLAAPTVQFDGDGIQRTDGTLEEMIEAAGGIVRDAERSYEVISGAAGYDGKHRVRTMGTAVLVEHSAGYFAMRPIPAARDDTPGALLQSAAGQFGPVTGGAGLHDVCARPRISPSRADLAHKSRPLASPRAGVYDEDGMPRWMGRK